MSPRRFLAEHTSREVTEWMAYYQLEPRGEDRGDLRAGSIAAAVYNVNRDTQKQLEPLSPHDTMLKFERPEPPSDDEWTDDKTDALERVMTMWATAHNESRKTA